ncbi:MAG: L,D-transpeptidase [Roseiarcus sp.]|jgi:lipoprotein-anchoring transpeptidase ErfK/SrfK
MNLRTLAMAAVLMCGGLLGGCQNTIVGGAYVPDPKLSARDQQMMALAPPDEARIPIERYQVPDPTGEAPGTIVIDTGTRNLYFVLPGRQAIKYRVATGAEAYGWTGQATVGHMQEWPTWMPTASIMERWPEFRAYIAHGPLAGAYDNPLGARALYLYQGSRDTLYRIHGTNEPSEIGQSVSSGCIRMRDLDVIDLYKRVHIGTRVVVK